MSSVFEHLRNSVRHFFFFFGANFCEISKKIAAIPQIRCAFMPQWNNKIYLVGSHVKRNAWSILFYKKKAEPLKKQYGAKTAQVG